MVLRNRKGAQPHVYLTEWMIHEGLSDETLGGKIGVTRQTIYRWRNGDRGLSVPKQKRVAKAIGLDDYRALHRLPSRPSIDAILKDTDAKTYNAFVEMARNLTGRSP